MVLNGKNIGDSDGSSSSRLDFSSNFFFQGHIGAAFEKFGLPSIAKCPWVTPNSVSVPLLTGLSNVRDFTVNLLYA